MEVDPQKGVPDGWEVVAAPTPPSTSAKPDYGVNAVGMPNVVSPAIREAATTPLAHPTGIDAIDDLTSPANIALLATAGIKPATQGALRLISGALKTAAPEVASEVVGLMSPRAGNALKIITRLAERAKPATAVPAPAEPIQPPAGATGTSMAPAPMPTPKAAPAPPAPVPAPVAAEPPPVAAEPAPTAPPLNRFERAMRGTEDPVAKAARIAAKGPSPAQVAMDEGLARRRAAVATAKQALVDVAPKLKLTAADVAEGQKMLDAGKSLKEVAEAIQAQKAFTARYGTPTPTVDQTKFPKGQRGAAGSAASSSPSPSADLNARVTAARDKR